MLFLNSLLIFIAIINLNESMLFDEDNNGILHQNDTLVLIYDGKAHDLDDKKNDVSTFECTSYSCIDSRFEYYKVNQSCPSDSSLKLTTSVENECCNSLYKCECNPCQDSFDKNHCKIMGSHFQPLIIRKGSNSPDNCCDIYICNSRNYTCNYGGSFHENQARWKTDQCTECICDMGTVKCQKRKCTKPSNCEVKKQLNSECCSICTDECKSGNLIYKNGEVWSEDDDCLRCVCTNGRKECIVETCGPLPCLNPIKTPGICCKHCPNNEIFSLKFPPHCKSIVSTLTSECSLMCVNGLKLDGNRCPTCECSELPMKKCSFPCDADLAFMPQNSQICSCTHQCQVKCNILCINGFKKDIDGCDTCICDESLVENTKRSCFDYRTGNEYVEGSIWFDGCRQCICVKGHQYCSLLSCNRKCSDYLLKDSCCPHCDLTETTVGLTSTCASPSNYGSIADSKIWNLDKCTKCVCINGMILCDVSYCPPTPCQNPIYDKENSCCPVCPNNYTKNSLATDIIYANFSNMWACFDKFDQKKAHGTTWKENDCLHCVCSNGERKCFEETCKQIVKCTRQIFKKGQCCPYCLDHVLINSDTLSPSSILENSFANSTFLIYVLALIIVILLATVVALIIHTIHRRGSHTLKSKLPSTPLSSKARAVTLNSFRLRRDEEGYDSFLDSFQNVHLLKTGYPKALHASLNSSSGIKSTTGLLNEDSLTSSLSNSKPDEGYIIFL